MLARMLESKYIQNDAIASIAMRQASLTMISFNSRVSQYI